MTIFAGLLPGLAGLRGHAGRVPARRLRAGRLAPGLRAAGAVLARGRRDHRARRRWSCSRGCSHERPKRAGDRCPTWPPPSPTATTGAARLADRLADRRADLPLRYWRQGAHFTTPAADAVIARKAVEGGTAPVSRMLERLGLTRRRPGRARSSCRPTSCEARLAATGARRRWSCSTARTRSRPATRRRRGRMAVAAERSPTPTGAGRRGPACASTGRPASTWTPPCATCTRCCGALRERPTTRPPFPLDGIVFPKLEHPEEVDLVHDAARPRRGRPRAAGGRIRVAYLVESGWAAAQLPAIARARRAAPGRPHLRHRRLQRRPGPAGHRQRPPARRLGASRDHRHRGGGGRAGHRRHDPRLPGRRSGPGRRRQPGALAGPDAAGLRRHRPRPRPRHDSASGSATRPSCSPSCWPTRPG